MSELNVYLFVIPKLSTDSFVGLSEENVESSSSLQ